MSLRRVLLAALAALLTMAAAGPAGAFVRSRNQTSNEQLIWKESCVPVTIYLNGFAERTGISMTKVVKSIAAAAHTWGPDGVTCGDGSGPSLEIVPTLSSASGPGPIGYDARNSLVFRTDNWTVGGQPPVVTATMNNMYADTALAVTTVLSKGDGHIVDADMEINVMSAFINWADLDPGVVVPGGHGSTADFFDLQNTVTHEFGHLVGLDHTCFRDDPRKPRMRPSDDKGNLVPFCDTPEASLLSNTVMFDTSPALETSKRTLSDDEVRAMCTIYPADRNPEACAVDSPSGCALAPQPVLPRRSVPNPVLVLVLVLVAVLVIEKRRRARS